MCLVFRLISRLLILFADQFGVPVDCAGVSLLRAYCWHLGFCGSQAFPSAVSQVLHLSRPRSISLCLSNLIKNSEIGSGIIELFTGASLFRGASLTSTCLMCLRSIKIAYGAWRFVMPGTFPGQLAEISMLLLFRKQAATAEAKSSA